MIQQIKDLEEAAQRYSDNWERITGLNYSEELPEEINKIDFINGAKWQSNYNYTEEEVLIILEKRLQSIGLFNSTLSTNIWFKQYKKI